jgi:hypothetical protein
MTRHGSGRSASYRRRSATSCLKADHSSRRRAARRLLHWRIHWPALRSGDQPAHPFSGWTPNRHCLARIAARHALGSHSDKPPAALSL